MKIILSVLLLIVFVGVGAASAQTEKQVAAIRNQVNVINRQALAYKKRERDLEDISVEGAAATYFLLGQTLKKINLKAYGETFNATTEFYYSEGKLIFVYRKFNRYDGQIGMSKPVKVVSVKESRYYFREGKLIRFLDGKVNVKSTTKFWSDSEFETLALETKVRDGLSNPE